MTITEAQKKQVISLWQKTKNKTEISKITKISRPKIREIINEHEKEKKWKINQLKYEARYVPFLVNTAYITPSTNKRVVHALSDGKPFWTVGASLEKIMKKNTAQEIAKEIEMRKVGKYLVYVDKDELFPNYLKI